MDGGSMSEFMPIMIDLENLPCLVVGGGKVARRKVIQLIRFKARVTVSDTKLEPGLQKFHSKGLIVWKRKRFSLFDFWGQKLIIAATDDPQTNRKVCRLAAGFGLLCNAVDDAQVSGFIFPAIHKQGSLVLSVSTQGLSPSLARKIKRELVLRYGAVYQDFVLKLGRIRKRLYRMEPDFKKRKRILNRLTNLGPDELLKMEEDKVEEWIRDG
jgi:precorrin-2 dehydrogenase / sirohydrochlorin ferrochelatase